MRRVLRGEWRCLLKLSFPVSRPRLRLTKWLRPGSDGLLDTRMAELSNSAVDGNKQSAHAAPVLGCRRLRSEDAESILRFQRLLNLAGGNEFPPTSGGTGCGCGLRRSGTYDTRGSAFCQLSADRAALVGQVYSAHVRRKRQRLRSNDPIESDPANRRSSSYPNVLPPGHFR
jgi:hypothetical protein